MKKIIFLALMLVCLNINIAFADDIENEEINLQEIAVETAGNVTNEPTLNSRAAVVIDRKTKNVLYEKNSNERRPMASTTKVMTAIIALEQGNLTDVVEVSKKAAGTGGSVLGIRTGDKITVNDLLYGVMLKSGNDAAVAIAEKIGGSVEGFAELMNKKAGELGLTDTHFVTPHGLDKDEHYTTPYELAVLTSYALENPRFREIVSTKTYDVIINGQSRFVGNTNELLGYLNGVYGVKTGFTNKARTMSRNCN